LVNDLIAGIQLRHDEMRRRSVGQHAVTVSVLVWLRPREGWQETVV
jgi:hypothetical protein